MLDIFLKLLLITNNNTIITRITLDRPSTVNVYKIDRGRSVSRLVSRGSVRVGSTAWCRSSHFRFEMLQSSFNHKCDSGRSSRPSTAVSFSL